MKSNRLHAALLLASAVALVATPGFSLQTINGIEPAPASSFGDMDSRWIPWVGCWELLGRRPELPLSLPGAGDPANPASAMGGGVVCINPAEIGDGVSVTTHFAGETFLEKTLVADGTPHDVQTPNCKGWQSVEWSANGRRLYLLSELTCGDEAKRSISGVSTMSSWSTWTEIQAVRSGDNENIVIRKFRPAQLSKKQLSEYPTLPVEQAVTASQARAAIAKPVEIDDVVEANFKVDIEAVESLLIESERNYELDGDTILELDDAGVQPALIDLMVALSYPDQFIVEEDSRDDQPAGTGVGAWTTLFGMPMSGGTTAAYDRVRYGRALPYQLAPFGYYYGYGSRNPSYRVGPGTGTAVSVKRVVNGRGYTRVTPRAPASGGFFGSRGGSSSGVSGSSSDGSAGGSVGRSGYSGGGSSGGRTAKPRKK